MTGHIFMSLLYQQSFESQEMLVQQVSAKELTPKTQEGN